MIRYLKTFLVAAQTASFSAAGAKIGLTQSAVSTQIQRLEEDLGCVLFDRSARAVTLSAAGRAMLPMATRIVAQYQQMQSAHGVTEVAGRIQIGAISSAQLGLMPQALQLLKARFPLVEVNIVPGMSLQFLAQVQARELDLAVMIRPLLRIPKDLQWTPVFKEPYAAIAPATTTETDVRALLETHGFIRYNRYSSGGQVVSQYLQKNRIIVREAMELDEPAVIVKMVEQGLGVSIIPVTLALDQLSTTVRVLPLDHAPIFRELGVLQPVGPEVTPIASVLIEAIVAVGRQLPDRRLPI